MAKTLLTNFVDQLLLLSADAWYSWLGLLLEPELPLEKVVNNQFQDAIMLEHLTAYKLHPKYRGEKLTIEQQQDVSTWPWLHQPFPGSYFSAEAINISPHTWWQ